MTRLHICNLPEDATRLSRAEVLNVREKAQLHQYAADGTVYSVPDDPDNLYLVQAEFPNPGRKDRFHWFKIAASKVPVT